MSTSISTPLDPVEEEILRNNCWVQDVGGRYKERVCEVGCVDHQNDCVDHYIQETQASSSNKKVDLKEIVELRQQIQHMNARFQSFKDFMMQYL